WHAKLAHGARHQHSRPEVGVVDRYHRTRLEVRGSSGTFRLVADEVPFVRGCRRVLAILVRRCADFRYLGQVVPSGAELVSDEYVADRGEARGPARTRGAVALESIHARRAYERDAAGAECFRGGLQERRGFHHRDDMGAKLIVHRVGRPHELRLPGGRGYSVVDAMDSGPEWEWPGIFLRRVAEALEFNHIEDERPEPVLERLLNGREVRLSRGETDPVAKIMIADAVDHGDLAAGVAAELVVTDLAGL